MTARSSRANKETGQHTHIKGDGKNKAADAEVKRIFEKAKDDIDNTPFMPNEMGRPRD